MAEIHHMTITDALALENLMVYEQEDYLQHFTAFNVLGELQRQLDSAIRDIFFTIMEEGEQAGFFCLRGLDAGYERPSFGVYVSSRFMSRGLARLALEYSISWCQEQGITSIMLKVAEGNMQARHIYESAGFVPMGVCPETGHIIMNREIN